MWGPKDRGSSALSVTRRERGMNCNQEFLRTINSQNKEMPFRIIG